MHPNPYRRAFLTGTAAAAAALLAPTAPAQPARTRLILLGTGGGPQPRRASSAAAQVIVAGGQAYVVDCGNGVARQLVIAGVPLASLRHIFITHHHSDHNADYGNLMLLAWTAGLRTQVDTWGPPPLVRMTELALALHAVDIQIRMADDGRPPLAPSRPVAGARRRSRGPPLRPPGAPPRRVSS